MPKTVMPEATPIYSGLSPSTFGHHLMAYAGMFLRDLDPRGGPEKDEFLPPGQRRAGRERPIR